MRVTHIFKAGANEVRAFTYQGKLMFVMEDICDNLAMEISQALEMLDADQKIFSENKWLINESGFYRLLFESKDYEAKNLKAWLLEQLNTKINTTEKVKLADYFVLVDDGKFQWKLTSTTQEEKPYKFFKLIGSDAKPKNRKVATQIQDGKIWFRSADVMRLCGLLGHTIKELKEDKEVKLLDGKIVIDEVGLYYHLFASTTHEARSFINLAVKRFLPMGKLDEINTNIPHSKKFRSWIKEELPKYISISEDGMIEYKKECREQTLPYKLFSTYPLSA